MSAKYPRFGSSRKPSKRDRGTCFICGAPTAIIKDIEYSYMRGEDGTFSLCERHGSFQLKPLLKALEAAYSNAGGR